MGAGQSNEGADGHEGSREIKTSYYELLGVEKQATDEEIKKAYRRKALELHPDRNYGDVERTTTLFAQVQSAYEVLSDPQERAWYDAHEDAILRDLDPMASGQTAQQQQYERNIGLTTAEDITKLFRRFHGGNVEFSDSPNGFYGFLRDMFAKLAKEEERAAQNQTLNIPDYPSFGHKEDTHDDVVKHFYAAWTTFSTCKTFAWRDKYRMSDAPDRWTRRAMDKENKRFRGEGIREFNDAVRSLVAFVKKRDPRFLPNTQSWEDRDKALREAAAAQAARQRAVNNAKLDAEVLPEWVTGDGGREEKDELEGDVDEEGEESEEEQYECVACRKTFKSEKQFDAHEKSKKHIKTVQSLRRKLQKEGIRLDLRDEDVNASSGVETPMSQPLSEEDDDLNTTANELSGEHEFAEDENVADDEMLETKLARVELVEVAGNFEDDVDIESISEDEENNDDESDNGSPSVPLPGKPVTEEDEVDEKEQKQPKLGKAAQKRAKKAAQAQAQADDSNTHRCSTCSSAFPSKTRLFQHLRDFNHAALVSTGSGGGGSKGKAKRGKR